MKLVIEVYRNTMNDPGTPGPETAATLRRIADRIEADGYWHDDGEVEVSEFPGMPVHARAWVEDEPQDYEP